MGTRNSICKKAPNVENGSVTFTFTDGQVVTSKLSDFNEKTVIQLALHGIQQKGGDSYAGVKNPEEARKSLIATLEAVEKGEWNIRKEGGPKTTQLVASLARAAGRTIEEAQTIVDGLDDDQKKALNKDSKVKAASAAIKLEKAQEAVAKAGADDGEGSDLSKLF